MVYKLIFLDELVIACLAVRIKDYLCLHLINLYNSFWDCWSKTNCTLVKSRMANILWNIS